ncbi:helix-turn-helix transcriptional regulator [Moritella sp. 28]|uniref:ArsR/SmtB family transcription factor n=1 Tax=Moritella sp. 28 TaxID=2746232 RepID=UPI001BA74233|nr:helix-turn-helix domain-containing protein [Moritella sp. 28]QUM85316.1 helix-turn-helix transcriptional regulator [Moritella sp. 28]
MSIEVIAKAFKELGHPVRLAIYKIVMRAGAQGAPVGKVCDNIKIPNSTLSHHISSLVSAGLISQRREGRVLFCVANYDIREQVIDFLQKDCCETQ